MHGHWTRAEGFIIFTVFLFIVRVRAKRGRIEGRRNAVRAVAISKVEREEGESIARVANSKCDDVVGKRMLCLHLRFRWRLAGSKPSVDACYRYALRHFW